MARRPGLCAQLPGGRGLATGGCALDIWFFSDFWEVGMMGISWYVWLVVWNIGFIWDNDG